MNIFNPYADPSAKRYIHNPYALRPTREQLEAVAKYSSRLLKDIPPILSGVLPYTALRLEADINFVTPVLVRKSLFSPERVGFMLKPIIKKCFNKFDRNLKQADESRELRYLYQQKLEELLSNPPSEDEYLSACKLCKMYPSTYVDAEFLQGMELFDKRTEFSLTAIFDMSPEPINVTIPEPLLRKWIAEVREEMQQEASSH